MDETDPGSAGVPESGSFTRRSVTVEGAGAGQGYASVSLTIPNDPALAGKTLFGRWFVSDAGAANGVAVSAAFRMTVFGTAAPTAVVLSSVSAASLAVGSVAPESIVSAFGENLAVAEEAAVTLPLPTTLAGVSVLVRDSAGSERLAPVFYASPRQINYQIPPGTAAGEAAVEVLRGGVAAARGTAQVLAVTPALFTANADGRGTAAALAVRNKPDGSQTYQATARFDQAQNRFISEAIDLGPEGDQLVLVLFGTGIRFRDTNAPVTATVGGEPADVLYGGAQPEFIGVDQVNLLLPRKLAGRGEVDVLVVVDGLACNTVRVHIQ
jgi:uncharacterized protein (TIGR03437 family)